MSVEGSEEGALVVRRLLPEAAELIGAWLGSGEACRTGGSAPLWQEMQGFQSRLSLLRGSDGVIASLIFK